MSEVLVLNGHPRPGSLGDALATAYADGARTAGRSVTLTLVRDLVFDAELHTGYEGTQQLEPDLVRLQEAITAAKRIVLVFPNWWGGMPARMKGLIDRTLLPGYAFKYTDKAPYIQRLLTGRTGRVIVTMDAPLWYDRLVYRAAASHVAKVEVLEFIGIRPVRVWRVGPVRGASPARTNQWIAKAKALGASDR